VLQAAKPWLSQNMEKGTRSLEEISQALDGMNVGIICLTPENLDAKWILFEAGALSKTKDAEARVCTYLLCGLRHEHITVPLSIFQGTTADESETRKLVHTINNHLNATPVEKDRLDKSFDKWWPDLMKDIEAASKPVEGSVAPPKRGSDEMITEILELNRKMASEIRDIARDVEYEHKRRELEVALRPTLTLSPGATSRLSSLVEPLPVPPGPLPKFSSLPTLSPPPLTPPPVEPRDQKKKS